MNKEVSNSMCEENDPHFDVITPVCKVCKNSQKDFKCKIYGIKPKEYGYAQKYDCPNLDLDKTALSYEKIKDKL